MPNDEFLTDDYVADLLAKEASDCSLKYSAMGLEAFNAKSKPTNMPKPNTRFLRHIIKDTDSHNKALLAKEAAESRARLKDLEHSEEVKRRKTNPDAKDIRKRQLGDIQSILGGKRQRVGDEKPASDDQEARRSSDRDRDSRKSSRKDDLVSNRDDRREYGRLSRSDGDRRLEKTSHTDEARRSKKSRHGDHSSDEESRHHRHRSRRDRSRSPRRRHRSRSPREKRSKHRHRSPLVEKDSQKEPSSKKVEDDSDPLEELIGPAPPPKYRGRGTVAGAAGIEMRFSEAYDPKTDVLLDEEKGGDWDDAVEAYRDRQKLRLNQEDRLRAAGFADHQIQQINSVQKEKTEQDVVWTKAGEKREWDRGKRVDDDGDVELRGIFSEDQ
ncbi:hypothetical protein PT974_03326 [Cladobotryum mycophilum]|uniref:Pre-mRNA-splicing factor 38B n=1 Tax=Cladobotryum mycophilum TaxID=491253 RepID=A0ABR0SSM0_9HYPO